MSGSRRLDGIDRLPESEGADHQDVRAEFLLGNGDRPLQSIGEPLQLPAGALFAAESQSPEFGAAAS